MKVMKNNPPGAERSYNFFYLFDRIYGILQDNLLFFPCPDGRQKDNPPRAKVIHILS
jgi:hypothetical protein